MRHSNLYLELLETLGQKDQSFTSGSPALYAVACRVARRGGGSLLEAWAHPLVIASPLPVLPLWLAPDLYVPLDLEQSYQTTCRVLRIP